jgi:hypothetical protein
MDGVCTHFGWYLTTCSRHRRRYSGRPDDATTRSTVPPRLTLLLLLLPLITSALPAVGDLSGILSEAASDAFVTDAGLGADVGDGTLSGRPSTRSYALSGSSCVATPISEADAARISPSTALSCRGALRSICTCPGGPPPPNEPS